MNYLVTPLMAVLLLGAGGQDKLMSTAGDAHRPEIRWSRPPSEVGSDLIAWHRGYRQQIAPVVSAWSRLLHRLRGDLPAVFDRQCDGLESSLDQLDDALLLPVPDRLIDLYLRRLLLHLRAAAVACSRGELYNVVHRLEEARGALAEVRWLLRLEGLGP